MTSLTIESFPSEVRGTGSVLALMMLDVGMIAGAPPLGMLADTFGFNAMFVAIGCIMVCATIAYWIASIPVWQERAAQIRRAAAKPAAEAMPAIGTDKI